MSSSPHAASPHAASAHTATSTIAAGAPLATLINVFTVEPARQRELVELLAEATDAVMRHQPGFVSANLHASEDGTRVVNYAQWESAEAYRAMLGDDVALTHMRQAAEVAEHFDPHLYEVDSVHRRHG